jgi:hypothetical protein
MNILLNQEIEIYNLVSRSGKFFVDVFQKVIHDMVTNYKDYVDASKEYMITTTKAVEVVEGKQLLDVEVLLPISYRIPVDQPYAFKERIKITNALYTKIGEVGRLNEAMNEINQYIMSNGLQPITSAYVLQSKQEDKQIVEIFIGLNPNII